MEYRDELRVAPLQPSPDLTTVVLEDPVAEPSKTSLKRASPDDVEAEHQPMKRSRSQVSPTMSPSAINEGFVANGNGHAVDGVGIEAVTIVGAGPAGLMLG